MRIASEFFKHVPVNLKCFRKLWLRLEQIARVEQFIPYCFFKYT